MLNSNNAWKSLTPLSIKRAGSGSDQRSNVQVSKFEVRGFDDKVERNCSDSSRKIVKSLRNNHNQN